MKLAKIRKKICNFILDIRHEDKILLRFISSLKVSSTQKILDIGCGYGRNLLLLQSCPGEISGVDVNPFIVNRNTAAGLKCMTVQEFGKTKNLYDVLLMSHIIEHFAPGDLLVFLDGYLERLKPGGYLIITTPLNSACFYEDFDHVRPYHPTGINMVFGGGCAGAIFFEE